MELWKKLVPMLMRSVLAAPWSLAELAVRRTGGVAGDPGPLKSKSHRRVPGWTLQSHQISRPGLADPTAPEQVSQVPGLREFRLPESQQILPVTGNRKPASDRVLWIQPVPCSSRRRSCPGRERGDRQSSVPADPTPSRASPTGRRIGGYHYKTEAIRQPRADNYTHFREMRNSNFLVPPPGGRSVREITNREETERPPEESAR